MRCASRRIADMLNDCGTVGPWSPRNSLVHCAHRQGMQRWVRGIRRYTAVGSGIQQWAVVYSSRQWYPEICNVGSGVQQ